LNDNLNAIGEIYRMALAEAQVGRSYTTKLEDPGILISATDVGGGTLYVLTSESSSAQTVSFTDSASGKEFGGKLDAGRAALLPIGKSGQLHAAYNWNPAP
jgi:hypothetical protein